MNICLRRRDFIAALGGAAAATWSLAARAQQRERIGRIGGVLLGRDENDPLAKRDVSAFTQALAGLGWTDGRQGPSNRLEALPTTRTGPKPGGQEYQ